MLHIGKTLHLQQHFRKSNFSFFQFIVIFLWLICYCSPANGIICVRLYSIGLKDHQGQELWMICLQISNLELCWTNTIV